MKNTLIAIAIVIGGFILGCIFAVIEMALAMFVGTTAAELFRLLPWFVISVLIVKLILDIKSNIRVEVTKE
jgi:hypothetical protein